MAELIGTANGNRNGLMPSSAYLSSWKTTSWTGVNVKRIIGKIKEINTMALFIYGSGLPESSCVGIIHAGILSQSVRYVRMTKIAGNGPLPNIYYKQEDIYKARLVIDLPAYYEMKYIGLEQDSWSDISDLSDYIKV